MKENNKMLHLLPSDFFSFRQCNIREKRESVEFKIKLIFIHLVGLNKKIQTVFY